jgi:ribosomal protein S18 acetylase RimI-like enzyme
MEKITIRRVSSEDLGRLQSISRETFRETFAAMNTEENMRKYLEEGFSTERLRTELMDPHSEFHFAEQDDNVIGYLKLNFGAAQTELQDDSSVEIERIYVSGVFQGKGVGNLLFAKAVARASEMNADHVWLGVWEENEKAIAFYRKNGFVAFDKHVFMLGDDAQTDIMMKLTLPH